VLLEQHTTANTVVTIPQTRETQSALGVKVGFLLMSLLAIVYGYFFVENIGPYWFSKEWTTDDAYQQIFPFIEVLHPGRFKEDITYQMMRGYLTPLHYVICYVLTAVTGSPLMMGHWVMLLQLLPFLAFTFLAVKRFSGSIPAIFAVVWVLHSREVIQRLTGGLPRGWGAPVLAAFLYFALAGQHKAVLITLFLGCLLHPPSTLIAALAYGLLLLWRSYSPDTRAVYLPRLRGYILLSPLYMIVTYLSIRMPAEFGSMASLKVAQSMPEFDSDGGRFPFVPLVPYLEEWRRFGFQAFTNKWERPLGLLENLLPLGIVVACGVIWLRGVGIRRNYVPTEVVCLGIGAVAVHALSRVFAFYLYVPNRHLQIPMALFFIVGISGGVWLLASHQTKPRNGPHVIRGILGLLCVTLVVVYGSGSGLQGKANFNTHINQKGHFAHWLRNNTPLDALVAGYPTLVDAVPLFAERKVYISTEMAHPFYKGYYDKIKDRIIVSLRAHYAPTLTALYDEIAPYGISYFVFQRNLFYPEQLSSASFFKPYDQLVFSLTRGVDPMNFAYRALPKEVNLDVAPFMPFKDETAAVVDVRLLGRYLGRE
jgi:hypothetical protein